MHSHNEHYQLDMQQGDTVTTVRWKETKPPWSHCVRWLLQETSPLKYRKLRCHGRSPELNVLQAHLALKGHPLCQHPVAWQPERRQLDCTEHSANPTGTIRGSANTGHTLWQGFISPCFCHHLHLKHFSCSAGTPLGHNSLKPFLMPRWESEMKKCLFHSTHHTDRLAQPLESTSRANKQKHRETSGLGKQFPSLLRCKQSLKT